MALTLVFTQKTKIDTLELDASLSETHGIDIEVTDHPVEQGANVTDHRRVKPRQVTIEGIVSNTPIPRASDPMTSVTAGGVTWQSRSATDAARASEALSTLATLAESSTLIDIVTSLASYENMTMTSLSVPRDAKSGQALRFTATFREIRVVRNEVVEIQAKTTRAKPKVDEHKKPASEDTGPNGKSDLLNLTEFRTKAVAEKGEAAGDLDTAMNAARIIFQGHP